VQPNILKHKDKDVRLLASCCLADLIRIYAPEAPFDDDQLQVFRVLRSVIYAHIDMKAIFKLFIEQLRGLEKKGPLFQVNAKLVVATCIQLARQRYFYLLERLAVVKAFILIVDISDDLVVHLFGMLFSIVK